MFKSIIDDVKRNFESGNMITRLIVVNVIIFIVLVLLRVFTFSFTTNTNSSIYTTLVHEYLATPGYWKELLVKPWTLFTSMFIHEGIWHLAWNMIVLYWFGRIVGDLLGDRKILPLYILGGIAGAVIFTLTFSLIYGFNSSFAVGASAGVMAIVVAAGVTSPDYMIHLPLIGAVRLKYVVLFVIIMNLIGTMGSKSGGAFAHLGGAILGGLYVTQLRNGRDIGDWVNNVADWFVELFRREPKPQSNLKVVHRKNTPSKKKANRSVDLQSEVDRILEKIKVKGFDQLSDEEKEILYKASKN